MKLLLSKDAYVKPRSLYTDWPSQVTSEPRTQYRSVGGLDALLYASRSGCYSCVEQLLSAGADMNRPTPEGVERQKLGWLAGISSKALPTVVEVLAAELIEEEELA